MPFFQISQIEKSVMKNKSVIFLLILLIFNQKINFAQDATGAEMRAVWVATAKNIDYPSSKYLSSKQQQDEFIKMLDLFKSIGINAIFFQVRPAADAFYESQYEPWSEWLCGKQGKRPDPFYDPLKFMINQAHKRNMEFHAWINPFRAVATIEHANIAPDHISKRKPEWIFTYGINKYFNPGIPEVREYTTKIIVDIVKRYDIDGIHFDDYFYPYPERNNKNKMIPIPDKATFNKYGRNFSKIEDWRRNNMDNFINSTNNAIKDVKPTMKFGIGPSGIWRNKGYDPDGSNTRGFAHYDYLYADVIKWLREGWIDYVSPQLYWNIGHSAADYVELVNWWSRHTYGRHLYIGQGVYNAANDAPNKKWRNPNELPNQMRINRANPKVLGEVFYKASSIKRNALGFNDSLRTNFYKKDVLPPVMAWLQQLLPPRPPTDLLAMKIGKQYMITWDAPQKNKKNEKPVSYKIYKFKGEEPEELSEENLYSQTSDLFITVPRKRLAFFRKKYTFVITSVDKNNKEGKISEPVTVKLKK